MFLTAQQHSSPWHSRVLLTLLASITSFWAAVPDPAVATPRPAAPAPLTVAYQSATSDYRLYDDNPPGDWRAANERVGEIGGWRTYAKEAYEASKRKSQEDASSGVTQ